MGTRRNPSPVEYDSDYLFEWGSHGLNFKKLTSLDPPGTTKKQEYLMSNVPHVTSMLRSGFKPDGFNSLQTDIPLSVYAQAWRNKIHPSVINKAYFVGSLKPEDLESGPESEKKLIRQKHRILPTINEGVHEGSKDVIPGSMGHFVSSLIAGATPEETLEAHRMLLPYATSREHYPDDRDEPEVRFCAPLEHYAKFRSRGGTHEEFKQLASAVASNHIKKGINQSSTIARQSLKSILSNYSDYRGMGLSHLDAGKAVTKFSEGTSPLMVSGDENFRKAIKNGATSDEYWDASNKSMDMQKYAEDRKTKTHEQALKKGVFDISSFI